VEILSIGFHPFRRAWVRGNDTIPEGKIITSRVSYGEFAEMIENMKKAP